MERYCQSCGMPMPTDEFLGKNADGSQNTDYCIYCYEEGEFNQNCTMDEMIDHCIGFLDEFNKSAEHPMSKDEAIANMKKFFPTLKRWKNTY